MADYNVDVVDHATGEIYAESLELTAAHDKIEREGWKHVETTSDEIPGDGCGGGEGPFILYTLWVDSGIDLASEEEMRRRAAAWWKYEEGGGQVTKKQRDAAEFFKHETGCEDEQWSDEDIAEFAKQLLSV